MASNRFGSSPLLRLDFEASRLEARELGRVGFDPELAAVRKSSTLAALAQQGNLPLALARLVRLWAHARALDGQRRGYPSGFAWCLMAVFFCQVRHQVPPLSVPSSDQAPVMVTDDDLKQAAQWLPSFFDFYGAIFRWDQEVVSTRLGRRAFKQGRLSGLCIEDPLEPDTDLAAAYLSPARDCRLRAELRRARRLLAGAPRSDGWVAAFRSRR
ncbi:unnamed protein product [Effrenium voratum]|nr:unnamed protein product [Effrenium voratum]